MAKEREVKEQVIEKGPSRADFVREQLALNPQATCREVKEAWKEAGNESELHSTTYYQVVKQLKREEDAKPRRGRPRKKDEATNGTASTVMEATYGQGTQEDQIESAFDNLLYALHGKNLADVETGVRQARRLYFQSAGA